MFFSAFTSYFRFLSSLIAVDAKLVQAMIPASTQLCGGLTACDPIPPRSSLVEVIRTRTIEAPAATAIRFGDHDMTYGELDRHSDALSYQLLARGAAGRNVLTGLLMERSPAMVVGLLAILKSGGAYVPLDPSYPAARIEGILCDAGVTLLLSETSVITKLGLPSSLRKTVLIEECEEDFDRLPRAAEYSIRSRRIRPTSSSPLAPTGRPKGVEISHGSLLNLLSSLQQEPGIEASDVMLAVTSIAF